MCDEIDYHHTNKHHQENGDPIDGVGHKRPVQHVSDLQKLEIFGRSSLRYASFSRACELAPALIAPAFETGNRQLEDDKTASSHQKDRHPIGGGPGNIGGFHLSALHKVSNHAFQSDWLLRHPWI